MNKTALLLVLLALATPLVAAQLQTSTPVDVSLLRYQPVPAQAGDVLDVYIQIANNGTSQAGDVQLQILSSDNLQPEGQSTVDVGTLAAQSTYVAHVKVRVDAAAPAGPHILLVQTKQGTQSWQDHQLTIQVQPTQASVFVGAVTSTPAVVAPGQDATVSLTIQNQADQRLRDLSVSLDLSNSPFIPMDGTARQTVQLVMPKTSADVSFHLSAKPGATADSYRIPVTITYLDELGETKTQTDTIGMRVDATPDVKAYIDSVTSQQGGAQVSVRIVNQGLSQIKFAEAHIASGTDYTVPDQERDQYVGNIDSDDWDTIRFSVKTTQQQVTIPITYSYKDSFNQEHNATQSFVVDIPAQQGGSGATLWIILIVIVVGGGGIWWYRRRRKK